MTVKEIVANHLRSLAYDGLYSDLPCGCGIDDLFPCSGEGCENCQPGYQGPDPSGEWDFSIYPTRADADKAKAEATAVKEDDK